MFEHWKDFLHPHEGNNHHPHAYRTASAVALACVVAVVLIVSALQTGYIRNSSGFLSSVLPSVLVDMTNENRLAEGLGGLQQNDTLARAANMKAEHMAENGYFAHDSPSGVTPWHWFQEAGYTYDHAGENLAVNFSDSQDVVEAWMESRLHRENILEQDFTEIGIGTARGEYEGKETVFVVQMFGTPDQRELAERQDNQVTETTQASQQDEQTEQAPDSDQEEESQTTSTEDLVAELSERVQQVQEDVQAQESVDGQQSEPASEQTRPSSSEADQQAGTRTNTGADTQSEERNESFNQATNTRTQTDQQQSEGQDDKQEATTTGNRLLAQQSGNQPQENNRPELEFATPTQVGMGSVAGQSGISLSPPGDTGWVDYLMSRPQLVLQVAMYTLIGLILLMLLISTAIEVKHHHFWQASVSLLAIVLILGIYAFVQDLLFIETIVAG